ncbi:MAG TPA: shikimate kinase [Thermoplasmata archaeon]|nr:shikimate kinase [Thermoplasmata archaeon]
MKGTARTFGAITVTNALSTGIGCAAGIALSVYAEVTLSSTGSPEPPTFEIPPDCRSAIVEESLRAGLARFFPEPGTRVRLALSSEIPVARGLKSSSAVSTAAVLALARAADREPSALEVGRVSAEVGRRVGVSATGALDDALAGLESGFVVTDNLRNELLRRTDVDPSWGVVLYVPFRTHPPAPKLVPMFTRERKSGERSARAAMDGDWARAMEINTALVERAMGYSYQALRDRLQGLGAIASGVCGLGPALAAIAPTERLPALLDALPADGSQRLLTRFARPDSPGGRAS